MAAMQRSCVFPLLLVLSLGFTIITYISTNTPWMKYTYNYGTYSHTRAQETQPRQIQKVIYSATFSWYNYDKLTFSHCEFSNCIAKSIYVGNIMEADIVILEAGMITKAEYVPKLPVQTRKKQFWLLSTPESQAGPYWRWKSSQVDNIFNGTMNFRQDSTVLWQWGYYQPLAKDISHPISQYDYSAGKTRAAFAYVSNCNSHNYDRLQIMKKLQKYIRVDIFGKCTNTQPCPKRMDYECEKETHKKYKFFLSFENSLCEDYITEKFWGRLASPSHYIPVAIGGTSMDQYTRIAPADSFLHAYNFSSVDDLGSYLKFLDQNNTAYNRYHKWRSYYTISFPNYNITACKLCALANNMPVQPAYTNLSSWWNNKNMCLQDGVRWRSNYLSRT